MNGYYRTILADPAWEQTMTGKYARRRKKRAPKLPYPTMTLDEIKALPVAQLAAPDCHLWLWTTNQFLEAGFDVMRAWGFKYLAPITWVKPSGLGNYFIHRTQTILFGYKEQCSFPLERYKANVFFSGNPKRHSQKPEVSYELIESVSPSPRLELFARPMSPLFPVRPGWHVWGNEVVSDVRLVA